MRLKNILLCQTKRSATKHVISEELLFAFLWWGLSLASIRSPLFSATGIQSCLCCSLSILLSLWQLRNLEISEYLKELQAGAVGMLNFFPKSFACCWSQFPFQLYYIIPSELKSIVNFFLWKESKDKNESYLFLQKKTIHSLHSYWKQRNLHSVSHLYDCRLKRACQTYTFVLF